MSPRNRNCWIALALAACLCAPAAASFSGESGNLLIQTFGPKQYAASPQNWAILEDARGVLYFGNTEGLLEFDGVQWRRIALPNQGAVRSLAMDATGRVYVGGQGEAGYLSANANGQAQYTSILPRLAEPDRRFGDVWSILPGADGVYFSTSASLIRIAAGGPPRVWRLSARLRRAFRIGSVIHLVAQGSGLHRLEGGELRLVPGGDRFAKLDARAAVTHAAGTLIVTSKGLLRQTATGFEDFPSGADALLRENSVYSALPLADGTLLLGTTRAGLLFLDAQGKLLRTAGKANGLPSDYIAALATDRQNGLWVATGNGLARFPLHLTEFDERNGLSGAVTALARWNGALYAGTDAGLFRLEPPAPGNAPQFSPVSGIASAVFTLVARPEALWVGTQRGLYRAATGKPEHVLATDITYDAAFPERHPGMVYAVGRAGAAALEWDGKAWVKRAELAAGGLEFFSVAEDSDGHVWIATRTQVLRVTFFPQIQQETFGEAAGVPGGWKNVFRIGERVVFATERGLRRFEQGRFVPDASFGSRFADGSHGVLLLREDARANLWFTGKGYHGLLQRGGGRPEWRPMPLLRAGLDECYALHADSDGVAWASGPEGRLARYQPPASPAATPRLLIRRVLTKDGQRIVGGGENPEAAPPRLSYGDNNVRIEFVAPFHDDPRRVEYQFLLDGSTAPWSAWSTETWRDLNNLWEGSYRFRVRARTPYGETLPEVAVAFRVAPPWYRTVPAYAAYVAVGAALLWLLLRWRTRQLQASNRRLESVVEERTEEIRQQRDRILEQERKTEALLLNILPEPVAAELRATGSVLPMHFADVTVCFTDFVGFTLSSESMAAADLVARLHEYFTEFDRIVTRYGLEKLKTIGDAYMFVSGLPVPSGSHAVDAVLAAQEIVAAARRLAAEPRAMPWKLRVGLHSGPVVAGVVGESKFAFDIWGDTVNLASRMESSGVPDRINLSERTAAMVRGFLDCEARGLVGTKDGRDLEMFFAGGLRAELLDAEAFVQAYEAAYQKPPATLPAAIDAQARGLEAAR